jgi:hypothetical protein
MMKISSLFLLFALFGNASAEGSCACEAAELGFAIDCTQTAVMLESLDFLNKNACATDCASDDCVKHYYIVQSHHDFCPEADVPEAVEDGFHDFDEQCKGCEISRGFVEGAPNCPVANCEDDSGNQAYLGLVENGCNIDCSSDTCRDLFFTLRIVHDTCPHDVLSSTSEKGLHDMERPCKDQICNDPSGGAGQLVCDPHAGHSGAFEWAGVFAVADASHMWSMQAIDGEYADPTMRLVLFPTEVTDVEAIHSTEEAAEPLIEGESCVVVEDGETMEPIAATGSCFELHVGSTDDSKFMINTNGVAGLVVYAQHVPIEFERDMHYLKDSAGTDIEPLVEEGGGGHGGHDHGAHDHDEGDMSGAAVLSTATGVAAVIGSMLLA